MSTFFEYMLKLSLCYVVIYLFYFLLLKRLTQYKGNRFFLLLFSLFAFLIPLIRVDLFIPQQTINTSSLIKSIPAINANTATNVFIPENSSSNISFFLSILFIAGVVICAVHFLIQIFSFKKIKSGAKLIDIISGIKLYHLNMDIIPFSFCNAIYLNRNRHSEDELNEILQHEFVHVHQKHTIDVMIAEMICILNWYNPFAWLIKHSIKQNLEFLADDAVIENGADKKTYQYLLLKVIGHSPLSVATNLNFSSLKKRIYMMNKTKTSKKHLLKFLFVLPVIALVMLAFRDTNYKTTTEKSMHTYSSEEICRLNRLSYSIADPRIESIVKKEQDKSLLQVGKPFTISLIKDERDRLKTLLEKNGYSNINDHSISFLMDSSLTNNSFSVQVNIDLKTRSAISKNTSNEKIDPAMNAIDNTSTQLNNSNDKVIQSTTLKQSK